MKQEQNIKIAEYMIQPAKEKIEMLEKAAIELGGTVYEAAADSGLLSAAAFMRRHFGSKKEWNTKRVKEVMEAFVYFSDAEELDRIFLQPADVRQVGELINYGNIIDGKWIIEYDRLKKLAEKGWKCFYNRREDGHNGKAFVRYHSVFGDNRKMIPFKMWKNDFYFIGNGINRALFVETKYEELFVMPDIHMVEEALRIVRAEVLIREKGNTDFWIERISMEDKKVLEKLKNTEEAIPESYKRIYYQIAYIMTYFPKEYEFIWEKEAGSEKISQARMDFTNVFKNVDSSQEVITKMKIQDMALLYVLEEKDFVLSLIKKISETEYKVLHSKQIVLPEDWQYEVWTDMKNFMMDAGLSALGIGNTREADRKAFAAMKKRYSGIKRQFIRCEYAKIIFDNGYLYMQEDYPISRFQKYFTCILKRNASNVEDFLNEAGISMGDISVVLLSGEESRYPFVKEYVRNFTGKEIYLVNFFSCTH